MQSRFKIVTVLASRSKKNNVRSLVWQYDLGCFVRYQRSQTGICEANKLAYLAAKSSNRQILKQRTEEISYLL